MIRRFLSTFVFGLLFTLIAANFYPFPTPARFPSIAETLANGGRDEVFRIRLPDDRLGDPRSAATAPFPATAFSGSGKDRIVAELYQVRDAQERVVGVASKLSGTVSAAGERGYTTDWMVVLPSRGGMILSRGSRAVERRGNLPADRLGLPADGTGILVQGTGEFEKLEGFFNESVSGVAGKAQTITLTTRFRGIAQ